MKIALYVPSWPPGSRANGIVTYAGHLVPALRRRGHEVFVLTPVVEAPEPDPYTIDLSFGSHRSLRNRLLFRLLPDIAHFDATSALIAAAIERLVREHQIDVVEIEESFGWARAISRLKLLPVVVRLHGPRFLTAQYCAQAGSPAAERRRETSEGRAIAQADFVTSPSRATLDAVRRHYCLELPHSAVIANSIRLPAKRWQAAHCNRSGLLFVGRFDSTKGGDIVIRAFASLGRANPELTLTFVGPDCGVCDEAGEVLGFEAFCRQVLPHDLRSRVIFTGALPFAEVMAQRARHFIAICASRSESFSYSVLEAMSFGSPVVASAVGGIPEMIESGRNGVLVPSDDVGALAAAVQALLDAPDRAVAMGERARQDCQARFGADQLAAATEGAYQQAIAAFDAARGG